MPGSRRSENAEATRRAIIRSARRIFAEAGYDQATLDEITRDARVTTGAVYHHFGGKEPLFRAVAQDVEADILAAVSAAAAGHSDIWAGMRAGVAAMLDIAAKRDIRQIAFVDAPRVIGPAEWRAIEAQYAFGLLKGALDQLAKTGGLKPIAPDVAAAVLLGALIEAANAVALARGDAKIRAEALSAIDAVISGFRASGRPSRIETGKAPKRP